MACLMDMGRSLYIPATHMLWQRQDNQQLQEFVPNSFAATGYTLEKSSRSRANEHTCRCVDLITCRQEVKWMYLRLHMLQRNDVNTDKGG